jgi:hypothetical protein
MISSYYHYYKQDRIIICLTILKFLKPNFIMDTGTNEMLFLTLEACVSAYIQKGLYVQIHYKLKFLRPHGWDLAEWLECLTANVKIATVLGSVSASSDTVESEGRQMRHCWIKNMRKKNYKMPLIEYLRATGTHKYAFCLNSEHLYNTKEI